MTNVKFYLSFEGSHLTFESSQMFHFEAWNHQMVIQILVYVLICARTYMHTHTHTCTHAHAHTHTHTHAYTQRGQIVILKLLYGARIHS